MPLFSLLLIALCLLCLIPFFWTFAPYFPTRHKDFAKIQAVANLKPGQKFYELGCGDGSVTFFLARKHPEVQFFGYEIFWPVYLIAKGRQLFYRGENVQIFYRNVFWLDLSEADWIYTFGMKDGLILKLRDKLLKELQPGAKVISYIFKIQDWPGQEAIHQGLDKAKIYVYTV